MKHIFLNTKRFDISPKNGGVNRISEISTWGKFIIHNIQDKLMDFDKNEAEFTVFFPEAHIISGYSALKENSPVKIGCQGIHYLDTEVGGNFGAFTTARTGNAMKELGCESVLIGHCEERKIKSELLKIGGCESPQAVNKILNEEIKAAQKADLSVLYCIGESESEIHNWQEVLGRQLDEGLAGADKSKIVVAYEPIWSIGPGKTPAGKDHIKKIAHFVKEKENNIDVVYGGGLNKNNATMLSSIDEIDGGLIALTRFTGEIGFYPDEYIEIVKLYLEGAK